ncbi:MAG: calcium/sodium antiporter [Planctomycetes bacterium]|nr:calcium/sodium antiporter [Planctomycetota bacterium]
MHAIEQYIMANPWCAWIVLVAMFVILAKCADIFVEAAVAIATKLNIPKLVIGIVLVSFATTTPELTVSMMAALRGNPEMALGNAIGSVICDDGIALALAGLFAAAPIVILPSVLRTSGIFLLIIEALAFIFVFQDFTLSRWEGAVLVGLFVGYTVHLYRMHKQGKLKSDDVEEEVPEEMKKSGVGLLLLYFAIALGGIILSSEFIVTSAVSIAKSVNIPESVIALTLVALGTSVPEIATCITAARKGHGDIAVGNILGADIMNICWVAGASAMANPLILGEKEIFFMFPAMFVIVGVMLFMLWRGYRLTKLKGGVLFGLYILYLAALIVRFPPETGLDDKEGKEPVAAIVDSREKVAVPDEDKEEDKGE